MDVYIKQKPKIKKKASRFSALFSAGLMLLGLFLVARAVLPICSWYFLTMSELSVKIISPLASTFAGIESYQPAAWFAAPKETFQTPSGAKVQTYTLSIPKLDIEAATVVINGDLKKSLVGWPTSPDPGAYGNNIVFGHSELPQFASPKSYAGIFTYLMTLDKDDELFLDVDGVRYRYVVTDKKIVESTDLAVLEQRFDASYLTLISCVPPGTVWKRGVIKARLATL